MEVNPAAMPAQAHFPIEMVGNEMSADRSVAAIKITAKEFGIGFRPFTVVHALEPNEMTIFKRFFAAIRDPIVKNMSKEKQCKAITFALRGIENLPIFAHASQVSSALADYIARDYVHGAKGKSTDEIYMKVQQAFLKRDTPIGRFANRIMHIGCIENRGFQISQELGTELSDPDILKHTLGITQGNARELINIGSGNHRTNLWWANDEDYPGYVQPDLSCSADPTPMERIKKILEPVESQDAAIVLATKKGAATKTYWFSFLQFRR